MKRTNTHMENDTTTTVLTLQHVDYLKDRLRKCERDKRRILLQINAAKMTNKDNRS
jgi:urease accessory protein UreE